MISIVILTFIVGLPILFIWGFIRNKRQYLQWKERQNRRDQFEAYVLNPFSHLLSGEITKESIQKTLTTMKKFLWKEHYILLHEKVEQILEVLPTTTGENHKVLIFVLGVIITNEGEKLTE